MVSETGVEILDFWRLPWMVCEHGSCFTSKFRLRFNEIMDEFDGVMMFKFVQILHYRIALSRDITEHVLYDDI